MFETLLRQQRDVIRGSIVGEIELRFETRVKSRFRAVVDSGSMSGQAIGVCLDRGGLLQDGDLIADASGEMIAVRAAREALCEARCQSFGGLLSLVYHLGNRHVVLELRAEELAIRFAPDPVLENLSRRLGAKVDLVHASFCPEPGAYAWVAYAAASESETQSVASPKIHDLSREVIHRG